MGSFSPSTQTLNPSPWIADTRTWTSPAPAFDSSTLCGAGPAPISQGFCGANGGYIAAAAQTSDGEYMLAGSTGIGTTAMEYYPTVRFLNTAVTSPTLEAPVGNDVALAGTNSSDQNLLTLYNPATDTEQTLIGPGNEIELYHLTYSPTQNKLFFDGLRFADNRYVLGDINLSNDRLAILDAGTTKWADWQPLN